jgi:1,4-dihydroxy-2-naphthoate octaprenyltransferase
MEKLLLFIRLSRPHFLVGGALMYALGAGVSRYLGTPVNWGWFFLGHLWITLLQLSTHYLNEYFDAPADMVNRNRTLFSGGSGAIGPGKLLRSTALYAGIVCLAIVTSTTVLLIRYVPLPPATVLVMALIFLGAFFYAVPPIRLESSGYGELTSSILVANLVPAFAMLVQTGDLHRLLAMSTFPLTLLHLAMLLALELPDYATDIKFEKNTLLVRIGWEPGMRMHNFLILGAYLILGLAVVLGLPPAIALPAFLSLPLGMLQIFQMNRIAAGAKPNWTTLTLAAVTLYSATAYLLAFSFWSR